MRSGLLIVSFVAIIAVVGLVLVSMQTSMTAQVIRSDPQNIGGVCSTSDSCMRGFLCLNGRCTINSGQVEILPGQLCMMNTPCKYGYACIENRCQLP